MTLIHTDGAICEKHNYPVQGDRVLHCSNFLGTRRRVESAFVLLTNSLNESAIVTAHTYCEVDLVVTIGLEALEAGLNLFDLSVNSQVVTKDQMDSVSGNTCAFCYKHSLASLVKLDIG